MPWQRRARLLSARLKAVGDALQFGSEPGVRIMRRDEGEHRGDKGVDSSGVVRATSRKHANSERILTRGEQPVSAGRIRHMVEGRARWKCACACMHCIASVREEKIAGGGGFCAFRAKARGGRPAGCSRRPSCLHPIGAPAGGGTGVERAYCSCGCYQVVLLYATG
eukprot:265597-Chlamydomonas_euryale.AAC.4